MLGRRLTTAHSTLATSHLETSCHRGTRRNGGARRATARRLGATDARRAGLPRRRRRRARPASRSWRSCRSRPSRSPSTTPTAGSCARRCRPASRDARRRPAIFALVEKNKDHRSNMYDDAAMPNMQRITWNGIALHGGPLPGYAASHGCVRMPFGFAEKLFDKTRIGMRVIISPNDAEPGRVFSPGAAGAERRRPSRLRPAAPRRSPARPPRPPRPPTRPKKAAAAAARETAALNGVAAQAGKAQDPRRRRACARRQGVLAAAKTDQAKAKAEEQKQKAAAKADRSGGASSKPPRPMRQSKRRRRRRRQGAAKDAPSREGRRPPRRRREAKLALEPVSIYISRATQKLYVRRNTHKPAPDGGGEVFDATIEVPVTIRDPDKPIGTHVFTAMARNETGLRWTAVTIDDGDDAKNALDRITIPTGSARSHRADRIAAILDHRLRRAAERRNQLSHRVRCGAEQPAPGRLHHAQADAASSTRPDDFRRRRLLQFLQSAEPTA